MMTPRRNTENANGQQKSSQPNASDRPTPSKWAFRHRVAVDTIAAAWLIQRFVPNGEIVFVQKQDDKSEFADVEWFGFHDSRWRALSRQGLFSALLIKLQLSDPALRKMEQIVADADTKGRSPSPLAITLTTLIQGWKRMPSGGQIQGEAALEWATPVFDALYANFQNQMTGPSH